MGRVLGQLRRRHEDTKIGVRTGTEREPDDASGRRCVRATAGPEDRGTPARKLPAPLARN